MISNQRTNGIFLTYVFVEIRMYLAALSDKTVWTALANPDRVDCTDSFTGDTNCQHQLV